MKSAGIWDFLPDLSPTNTWRSISVTGQFWILRNADREEDCLIGFVDTPWHTHGDDLMFADANGNCVEINYLDLLTALKEGKVLVRELRKDGQIVDRALIHSKYNDEFEYLEVGEEVTVRRAAFDPSGGSPKATAP